MTEKQTYSINSFLDSELDALPDAPVREVLPAGKYVLRVKNTETTKAGDKEVVKFVYNVVECNELANPAKDSVPKSDVDFEQMFFTENATGLGNLKELLQHVKSPGVKVGQLLPALVNEQFVAVVQERKWKDKTSGEQRVGWDISGGLRLLGS